MKQTKQQRREKRTEYRERMQLKVAREIVARKTEPTVEAEVIAADYTGATIRNYVSRYYINGREVTKAEYVAHLDSEQL